MSRRFLGGEIPSQLDIQIPVLGTKISLDVPQHNSAGDHVDLQCLTSDRIIDLCENAIRGMPSYSSLLDEKMKRGERLALAWRHALNLEWAWLKQDIYHRTRDWEAVFGLALQQVR